MLLHPFVKQGDGFDLLPFNDGSSGGGGFGGGDTDPNKKSFGDNIAFAPWGDNLIRWLIRFNLRPLCWFVGDYEVMFAIRVQFFYDCQTWMNVDLLAFQPNWGIIGFCPKITELWNGIGASADAYV